MEPMYDGEDMENDQIGELLKPYRECIHELYDLIVHLEWANSDDFSDSICPACYSYREIAKPREGHEAYCQLYLLKEKYKNRKGEFPKEK